MTAPAPTEVQPTTATTVVVGLGNPVLGDDGVGWLVADALAARLAGRAADGLPSPAIEIDRLAVGGLRLMERLVGYDLAVVIDAHVGGEEAGTIRLRPLEELLERPPTHLGSSHDASLPTALAVGRALGGRLPERVMVLTVEALPGFVFSEELSPAVAAAVGPAAALLLDGLLSGRWSCTSSD